MVQGFGFIPPKTQSKLPLLTAALRKICSLPESGNIHAVDLTAMHPHDLTVSPNDDSGSSHLCYQKIAHIVF